MKTSEWFICLPFKDFDILIPQEVVRESTYAIMQEMSFLAQMNEYEECNFDNILSTIFNRELSSRIIAELEVLSEPHIILRTGAIPRVLGIELKQFKILNSSIGSALRKKGIIAIRFADNHIQYLMDIKKILEEQINK